MYDGSFWKNIDERIGSLSKDAYGLSEQANCDEY